MVSFGERARLLSLAGGRLSFVQSCFAAAYIDSSAGQVRGCSCPRTAQSSGVVLECPSALPGRRALSFAVGGRRPELRMATACSACRFGAGAPSNSIRTRPGCTSSDQREVIEATLL